jgi:hypothetical protein
MKNQTIKIRLDRTEKRKIVELAKKAGFFQVRNGIKEVNVSQYVRMTLLQTNK